LQAEGLIRYRNVTGVQTCALPIYYTFVGVYADGLHNRDAEMAQVRPANLKDYHLSDFTVHRLSPQVVLLTYKVVVNGESGGKDVSGTYWVASVWQMRGQQWRTMMHAETKAS